MVSKSQIKLITSLAQKKYRQQHGLFVVEGIKGVSEFLASNLKLHSIYSTGDYFEDVPADLCMHLTDNELKKVSFLKTPQKALAIFHIPESGSVDPSGLQLALDDVRDPGNLGTIIRLCDWFGVKQLICSPQTVDCYNPKVVQATMGSLTRVHIKYTNLSSFLTEKSPVYGAFMDGENVYEASLPQNAIVVMGNEANGISKEVEKLVSERIAIPQFGTNGTESLNVATATAILLSEFKRRF